MLLVLLLYIWSCEEVYRHYIYACINTIGTGVDQASSSTAQDGTTKEAVSDYHALTYASYITCLNNSIITCKYIYVNIQARTQRL